MVTRQAVMDVLEGCYDPCCRERELSVVDMGLIHEVRVRGARVEIDMILTSGWCPSVAALNGMMTEAVAALPGVEEVAVEVLFDPVWTTDRLSPKAEAALSMPLEPLLEIRNRRVQGERRATA